MADRRELEAFFLKAVPIVAGLNAIAQELYVMPARNRAERTG